jgi:exodeoxyribonuclease V gamma subunit
MLYSYRSNRLEILTDRLTRLLQQPLHSPLAPEIVLVQSKGMARWLALRLADRLGICANLRWQFPARFLWDMTRAVLGKLSATSVFDKPILIWRLMDLLRDLERSACFEPLQAYLGAGSTDFQRYELAYHIADCFDQYLIYRPDWIGAWEAGEGEHWQAELWRRLARHSEPHRVQIQTQFAQVLASGHFDRRRLPERIAIVGVAALPPLYLDLLAQLAKYVDVHWFLLDPCREYWGDIQAERDIARLAEEIDPEEAYLTVGHPLLASLGKQGRDFLDLLHAYPCVEWEQFAEPVGANLLQCLQADILHLRERGSDEWPSTSLSLSDHSVQVHVCHGPMREVEVLHDQLLALFQAETDLRPSDAIVMTPDIATYGPLLEAVFGSAPPERQIRYSVADQGIPAENPLIEVFFELLDLSGGRFNAAQVVALLEAPAVRRCFELSEDEVEHIRRWVRAVGIRWGVDASAKSTWGLPVTAEHTWQMGLDRLLLGYALPGQGRDLYGDLLPYDEVEGSEVQALGRLHRFTEALFGLDGRLQQPRPLSAWVMDIGWVLEQFFAPREREENELQLIRDALGTLQEHAMRASHAEPISLGVVKSALRRELVSTETHLGRFLGNGVTCCAMVPMRSIPFQVVCLIGMNDDAYPRPQRPVDFDLMAARFRRGDRSRRQDDRYLFLETVLSARRCFYLSYVGQNIRDNSTLPPSVLVSELLELINRGFQSADGGRASEQLVIRHPLQAFSRRYFNGEGRLFSYAQEWVEASRHAGRGGREARPLLTTMLPEADSSLRTVTLDGLARFFKNPVRWLLQERLGIRPAQEEEALETREPFILNGLENYQLAAQMLELYLERRPLPEIQKVMQAGGGLPHGQVGSCVFTRTESRVVRFAGRLGRVLPGRKTDWLNLDLTLGEFRLTDRLTGLTPTGWVGYRLARIKAADYLSLWLHHLALNIAAPAGMLLQSQWIAEDQNVVLNPVQEPEYLLQALLELYWQGTRRLLHFFPKSALAYAQQLRKEPHNDKALRAARTAWEGSEYQQSFAERDDPYYQLAFQDTDPLDSEFVELAAVVFEPLFACMQPDATSK